MQLGVKAQTNDMQYLLAIEVKYNSICEQVHAR
jgi:hypothetical protein